jgi:glutamate carboxypeptidase
VDPPISADAAEIAAHAERELEALVAISTPSGDMDGAEEAIALCAALLPPAAQIERVPCSTPGNPPDLIARISGAGAGRVLLLGHLDTVVAHHAHRPLSRDGGRLYGPGTVDMKGGVVLALGLARALSARPESFEELSVLLVTDEEWRSTQFAHAPRFAGYHACLCFEAGERTHAGDEAVVVRRKAAGTLRVGATGRAAHSGSAPDQGRNALIALAQLALALAEHHDPNGPDRMSVVPTVVRSGDALNVVPAEGELLLDMRADGLPAFESVLAAVPAEIAGVRLEGAMQRRWPGMDARAATAELLTGAASRLGRPASIEWTVDGLGPRGGNAHNPGEFVLTASLEERAQVALALADEVLARVS